MQRRWLVSLAIMLSASSVSAQSYYNFGMQCTTGSLRACASVSVSIANSVLPDGLLWSRLLITVSNPQGTPGFEDAEPFSGFKGMTFWGIEQQTGLGTWSQLEDLVSSEGNVIGGPAWLDTPNVEEDYISTRWDRGSQVFGCDVPDEAVAEMHVISTCGGSFTYAISFARDHYYFSKEPALGLRWWMSDVDNNALGTISCTTGVDCALVTPEPITLLLFGSGLAAVGAARRRRRSLDC